MYTQSNQTTSLIGVLLLGAALLVPGCDSAGPSDEGEPDDSDSNPWSASSTLSERVTNYEGSSASGTAGTLAKAAPNFEIKSRVAPPDVNGDGTPERASHLSVSSANDRLYVSYKIVGDPYGGGIDILDISGSFTDASDALQTDQLDVQELAVRDNDEALFVGTALDPGNFSSPSQFHSINLGSNGDPAQTNPVEYAETQLPGTLVKSVVAATNSSTYDAFAVSDINSFHGIETTNDWEIGNVTTEERATPSGLQFRSVTEASSGTAYALSDGGNLYEFSSGLPQITSSSLGSLGSDRSIARLSAHSVDASGDGSADSEFLFVSLNENGFRVVDPGSGEVVYSETDTYTTSITATADLVYVATGDGLSVFEVGSGLANTDPTDGLNDLGRASLSEFDIQGGSVPTPTDAQVNHVAYDGTYLYVAKSTDGVYKVEPQDPEAYSAWSAVGTLGKRITNYEGSGSSGTAAAAKQSQSFEIKSWVAAPDVNNDNEPERASHLSVSTANDKLYVGYKILDAPFGGGIDIIDIGGSFADASNALQTDRLDVQELSVRDNDEALFVGTALDPGNFSSPSQLHSINLEASTGDPVSPNDVEHAETQLPGQLVKSVMATSHSSTYDAFAVSDANSTHGIETAANDWEITNVATEERSSPSNLLFRSVTETSDGTAYALGNDGHLYEFTAGLPQITNTSLGALDSDASIARLTAHSVDASGNGNANSEFIFVSLNENGFRVFDPNTSEVVFSDADTYTTSVTAISDFVYVATGDGLSLYEVGSGLNNTDTGDGLHHLGRASLSDFEIQGGSVPTPTDAQVNHIVHDGSYLYIAKSTDGVYKVEQISGSGPWN